MSGWKEVQASMRHWFDQHVVSPIVAEVDQRLLQQVSEDTQQRLQQELARLDEQRRADQQRLSGISDEVKAVEERTTQRLADHARATAQQLSEFTGALQGDMAALLDSVTATQQVLRAEVASERRQREEQATALRKSVQHLETTSQEAAAEAERWHANGRVIRDVIAGLPHAKFAPGRLDALDEAMQVVESDLSKGFSQVALGGARTVAGDLLDLRREVEMARSEWTVLQAAARGELLVLAGRIEANRQSFVRNRSGEALAEARFDIDKWSGGRLTALIEKITATTEQVNSGDLDLGELRRLIRDRLPEHSGELADIIELAQQNVVSSQLRANIADIVANVLETRFAYQTERWTYHEDDQRQAVVALLELSGNEIVLEVAPGDEPAINHVRMYSFDSTSGSLERRQDRLAEVSKELRERGVDLGEVVEHPDPDRMTVLHLFEPASAPPAAQIDVTGPRVQVQSADRSETAE